MTTSTLAPTVPTHPYNSRVTINLYASGYRLNRAGYDLDAETVAEDARCPHCRAPQPQLEYLSHPDGRAAIVATCPSCFAQEAW